MSVLERVREQEQEQRREYQVHQFPWNQNDTESYHHEAHEEEWGIDAERTPYLFAVDPKKQ